MTVDFEKLHKLLMPTFTRLPKMTALLIAIATPFQNLFASFQSWQADIRLQAATTCQVMYLENILNYRLFGSFTPQITITDGDGITVDFIVNIPAGVTVNGQLLIGLLEQYKLKGKRYNVVQSTRQYSVVWSDPVCELVGVECTAVWSDPVCELAVVTPPPVSYLMYMGNSQPSAQSNANACSIFSASRAYYISVIGGNIQVGDTLYNDDQLSNPVRGYADMYLSLSLNGTGSQVWVQIDNNGIIIAAGSC
jgi:hypothetical protein